MAAEDVAAAVVAPSAYNGSHNGQIANVGHFVTWNCHIP
jgi:hypothetical protein